MSDNFVVAHVTKYKASSFSSGTLSDHIDRKHVPQNARPEAQNKNFEFRPSPESNMFQDIQDRIEEGYKGKRAVRKDAVVSVGVIFSGSHDGMKRIEEAGLIEDWARKTYKYACKEWGEENIVRATVHLDELTPHMHLHFVPLTKDGKLSAKEIVSKDRLKKLQEDYSKQMEDYGLKRGIEGSENRHITTKQYYQRQGSIKKEAQQIANDPNSKAKIEQLLAKIDELSPQKNNKINPDKANHYETIERREERGKSSSEQVGTSRKTEEGRGRKTEDLTRDSNSKPKNSRGFDFGM